MNTIRLLSEHELLSVSGGDVTASSPNSEAITAPTPTPPMAVLPIFSVSDPNSGRRLLFDPEALDAHKDTYFVHSGELNTYFIEEGDPLNANLDVADDKRVFRIPTFTDISHTIADSFIKLPEDTANLVSWITTPSPFDDDNADSGGIRDDIHQWSSEFAEWYKPGEEVGLHATNNWFNNTFTTSINSINYIQDAMDKFYANFAGFDALDVSPNANVIWLDIELPEKVFNKVAEIEEVFTLPPEFLSQAFEDKGDLVQGFDNTNLYILNENSGDNGEDDEEEERALTTATLDINPALSPEEQQTVNTILTQLKIAAGFSDKAVNLDVYTASFIGETNTQYVFGLIDIRNGFVPIPIEKSSVLGDFTDKEVKNTAWNIFNKLTDEILNDANDTIVYQPLEQLLDETKVELSEGENEIFDKLTKAGENYASQNVFGDSSGKISFSFEGKMVEKFWFKASVEGKGYVWMPLNPSGYELYSQLGADFVFRAQADNKLGSAANDPTLWQQEENIPNLEEVDTLEGYELVDDAMSNSLKEAFKGVLGITSDDTSGVNLIFYYSEEAKKYLVNFLGTDSTDSDLLYTVFSAPFELITKEASAGGSGAMVVDFAKDQATSIVESLTEALKEAFKKAHPPPTLLEEALSTVVEFLSDVAGTTGE